jgi:hypothetical protein
MNGKDAAAQRARSMRNSQPPRSTEEGDLGGDCAWENHMRVVRALESLAAHVPMEAEEALWVLVYKLP